MAAVRTLRDRLRRPDWLAELQVVVVIGLVATGLAVVVNLVALAMREPIVIAVPAKAIDGLVGSAGGLRTGAAVTADSTVEIQLADPSLADTLWYAAGSLPELLLVVAVLALLLRLIVAARRADPFTAATVRRLRVLGGTSAIGGVLTGFASTFAQLVLTNDVSGGDLAAATLTVNPIWILVGGGFLAFGEIVNRGRARRAELDTVI